MIGTMYGGYGWSTAGVEGVERGFPFGGMPRPVILDTDTFNEIDDQFALVYALLSPEAVDLRAVTAAPFLNQRSVSAGDGMEKSLAEIRKILGLMGADEGLAVAGSVGFCVEKGGAVESAAARRIIEESLACDGRLVVVAIGAPTNVASALMMDEGLKDRISVVWLGGHALWHRTQAEFNLQQDLMASRVLFDSGVPLVLVPCVGVATHLSLTRPEVEAWVRPCGAVGEYLASTYCAEVGLGLGDYRVIWDLAAVAALTVPGSLDVRRCGSPVLEEGLVYRFEEGRGEVQVCFGLDRGALFGDFWGKLGGGYGVQLNSMSLENNNERNQFDDSHI